MSLAAAAAADAALPIEVDASSITVDETIVAIHVDSPVATAIDAGGSGVGNEPGAITVVADTAKDSAAATTKKKKKSSNKDNTPETPTGEIVTSHTIQIDGKDVSFTAGDRVYHGTRGKGTVTEVTTKELYIAFDVGETRRFFWKSVFKLTLLRQEPFTGTFMDPRVEIAYQKQLKDHATAEQQSGRTENFIFAMVGIQCMATAMYIVNYKTLWGCPERDQDFPERLWPAMAHMLFILLWTADFTLEFMIDQLPGRVYLLGMACISTLTFFVADWVAYAGYDGPTGYDRSSDFQVNSMVPLNLALNFLIILEWLPLMQVSAIAASSATISLIGYACIGVLSTAEGWVSWLYIVLVLGIAVMTSWCHDSPGRATFFKELIESSADYSSVLNVPTDVGEVDNYIKNQERVRRWMVPDKSLKMKKAVGAGSFGEVWLGTYLGTNVAVKKSQNLTPEGYAELIKEFLLHIEIRHPAICQLLGLSVSCDGSTNPRGLPNIKAAFILEFMGLGNLDDLVYSEKKFTYRFVVNALSTIAQGIAHLHYSQPQILHADLKSENIFVDEHGTCKVGDLGGSVQLDALDQHNEAPFSFLYASPKRLAASVDPSIKVVLSFEDDVFAFAVMIFELFTRCELWKTLSKDEIFAAITEGIGFIENELPTKSCKDVSFLEGQYDDMPFDVVQQTAPKLLEVMRDAYSFEEQNRPDFKKIAKVIGDQLEVMETACPEAMKARL